MPATANLPGWRWTRIKQLVLVGSSSSLHSEVCNALGGTSVLPTAKFLTSDTCVRALSTRLLLNSKYATDSFVHNILDFMFSHRRDDVGTCRGVLSPKWERTVSGICRVHRCAKRSAEMAPGPFPHPTCTDAESGCVLTKSVFLQGGIGVSRSHLADSAARTDPGWKQSR